MKRKKTWMLRRGRVNLVSMWASENNSDRSRVFKRAKWILAPPKALSCISFSEGRIQLSSIRAALYKGGVCLIVLALTDHRGVTVTTSVVSLLVTSQQTKDCTPTVIRQMILSSDFVEVLFLFFCYESFCLEIYWSISAICFNFHEHPSVQLLKYFSMNKVRAKTQNSIGVNICVFSFGSTCPVTWNNCSCLRNPFSLRVSVWLTDGTPECCFRPCSHLFPGCYLCCLLHLAPQRSYRDTSVATRKVRCYNDLQCKTTIHVPRPWQRTVSTPSTVPCQPLSKKKKEPCEEPDPCWHSV